MPPPALPTQVDVATRSLYVYESYNAADAAAPGEPLDPTAVATRALYLAYNGGAHGNSTDDPLGQDDVLVRTFYMYVNIAHDRDPTDVALRAIYDFLAYTNDEMFPWIERIVPNEQLPGGQVALHGDGFGANPAAEGGSVRIGIVDPAVPGPGLEMGVVSWLTRSPNLYPANGVGDGITNPPLTTEAIVVTVPDEADSGMVVVELTI